MIRLDDEFSRRSLLLWLPGALMSGLAMASPQPPSPPAARPSRTNVPRLPGAVTRPPEWLGPEAPFDVAAYFKAPPDDQNAAPLYLDALFEFGPEMAVCFPEGPVRARRERTAKERMRRYAEVAKSLERGPDAVPPREMNAFLALYDEGLAKLARAQERPRCVFQAGIGMNALLPHLQDARNAGRVLLWKARRLMEQGSVPGALQQASRVLRLVRDLQPRGFTIAAMVGVALERLAMNEVFLPLLQSRGLKAEHCDAALAILREHDSKSIDVYSEVLRGEYLLCRSTLRDLVLHQDQFRRDLGAAGVRIGPSLVESVLDTNRRPGQGTPVTGPGATSDLDAKMASMTPSELARQEAKLTALYRDRLGLAGTPYAERIRRLAEPPAEGRSADILTRVALGLVPAPDSVPWSALVQAALRSLQALTAVRRWQIRHSGQLPASLESAARDAGLARFPIDPYTGGPVRLAILDGKPVAYCLGEDGKDDQGRTAATRPGQRGDVVLRMPDQK
ncbi:hypothetical protein OJF2_47920 [Aquisphaera giovannonii]|uniref:Uncharacterized protein n=1 Tax=Aquisphaera giovannonii TaxID=406548 RepID=A0A5B9W6E5_9BACT|nr:hypothetical protein [Aquisphaera giovannonii]QEH36232.1 hypothetical protein OJF2_47920 [Aquisphaera giovannonii]